MEHSRARILAIDDTPANLLTLGAALTEHFEVQTATSGETGIALALKAPPDLILLDVMMPEVDGFETCRRLKAEPATADVPIIFVTALDGSGSEMTGLSLGGADYLTKPINVEIARLRINNLLDREALRKRVEAQRDQLTVLLAEREKTAAELRVAAAAFDTQDGMTITDPRGVILKVNRSFTRLTGYSAEEVIGKTPALLKSGRHDEQFYCRMWDSLLATGHWQGEIWNKRKNGQIYAEMLTIKAVVGPDGATTHYIANFTDITEDKQAEAEIHRLAYYDTLTRLPNRRLLQDRLGQALAASARTGQAGAIYFLGLDNFKALNDTRGHGVGDILLVEIAQRLRTVARDGETVARLGSDEYMLLVQDLGTQPDAAMTMARQRADELREAVNRPCNLEGFEHPCKVSIGACLFGGQDTVEELLKRADLALYKTKKSGRDGLCFFDPSMQAEMNLRSTLEADLSQALRLDQLCLYYQPQVDATGRHVGVEALLRWRHPQRGLVAPGEFIRLAENTGLILPIGRWALETACAVLKTWEATAHTRGLQVSVNVSARQFRQPDFVMQIRDVLAASGANPGRLKLELTESLVLENIDDTVSKMVSIRDLGVSFSMDDFGTGYSSLAYLAQLPLDQLKIDQSFVRNLPGQRKDESIARTIISLGRELGMNVVAEGVETEAQRDFLLAHGCDAYQGYLFGRPMPLEELALLQAGS